MNVDLVHVTTEDDIVLAGAYLGGAADRPAENETSIDCVCFFHGDTGSFATPMCLDIAQRFADKGIAFLSGNRRGHDIVAAGSPSGPLKGYANESVDEARLDYRAWLDHLRGRGHRAFLLAGHSGGAVRAVYAQAKECFPDVKAVLASSPGDYVHEELARVYGEAFTDAYRRAEALVQARETDVYLRPGAPFGATWSPATYVDLFHPDNRYSVSARVAEIDLPTLFVYGGDDLPLCLQGMRNLRALAYPHVAVETIDGANHVYVDHRHEWFERVYAWMARSAKED